ncbi:MAG: hypothetical protein ABEI96_11145 [Haloarculaceae archaeon]
MSEYKPTADGPTSPQEFEATLAWLLRTARENGVDVEGGWMDRTHDRNGPDWGIEIYEVLPRTE